MDVLIITIIVTVHDNNGYILIITILMIMLDLDCGYRDHIDNGDSMMIMDNLVNMKVMEVNIDCSGCCDNNDNCER